MTPMLAAGLAVNLAFGLGAEAQPQETQRAKEATLRTALLQVRQAVDQYFAKNNHYPRDLKTLRPAGYVATIPKDPFTGTTSWRLIPAKAPATGFYGIKSRSKLVALDGTHYSDW